MTAQSDRRSCAACGNSSRGFFCSIAGAHLERIGRGKIVHRYQRGDIVFREGEPASAIHCIQQGTVKVYKLGRDGEEVVIRLLGPGDIMGYRPLLANDTFAANASVLEDTTVCTVTRKLLMAALRESPELASRMMEKLAAELRVSEDQMVRRVVETVPQRTARFLLWLHDAHANGHNHVRFESLLRREDMAMVIGTTPETLSRTLHDLERRNVVGLERRAIQIRELEKLQHLAAHGTLD
jgi:CRP-like cAMP-binding protein